MPTALGKDAAIRARVIEGGRLKVGDTITRLAGVVSDEGADLGFPPNRGDADFKLRPQV